MIKNYLLPLLIWAAIALTANSAQSQTISTYDVPTSLCANENFNVSFTVAGVAPGNYTYKVELSNSSGFFFSPVTIGTLTTTKTTDIIKATIPSNTTLGATSTYRIRVTTTDFSNTATDNGNDIVINCTSIYYRWIGGSGNWSDVSHWEQSLDGVTYNSPLIPPTISDNVSFDANSFPTGGTLTIDQFAEVNDFTWQPGSGDTNPIILTNGNTLKIAGSFVLDAGVVTNFATLQFNSVKKNIEVNYGGNILASPTPGDVYFEGGGSWNLNSDLNANNLFINDGSAFYTQNNQINLTGQLQDNGVPGAIFDAGTSDIYLKSMAITNLSITGSETWHFNGGGNIGNNTFLFNVNIESGLYIIGNSSNTFNNLTLLPGTSLYLDNTNPLIVVSKLTALGTRDKLITIASKNTGFQATLDITTTSNVNVEFLAIQDNNLITSGSPQITNNSVDNGNNQGWTINSIIPFTYYWIGGSGNWSEYATHWAISSGGGGFHSSPPGSMDDVVFDASSFPAGGQITIDGKVACNSITWQSGSGANNPTIFSEGNNTLTVYGDFILDNGVKRDIETLILIQSFGNTSTLNFADNSYETNNQSEITLQGGGTFNLTSNLGVNTLKLNDGSFNTNGNQLDLVNLSYNNNVVDFGSSTVNIGENLSNSNAMDATNFNAASATFNFVSDNTSMVINGLFNFNNVTIDGTISINGDNTFQSLTIQPGSIVTFESSKTQFINANFDATGLRDQPIQLKSSTTGNTAFLSQNTGTNSSAFLQIEDVNNSGLINILTDYSKYNGAVMSGINFGWDFNSSKIWQSGSFYWVGGSGNWSDFANHWAKTADGSTGMQSFAPGPGDKAYFSSNSFTGTGQQVILDNPITINSLEWLVATDNFNSTISANSDNPLTVTGDFLLAQGVQRNIDKLIFNSNTTANIDFADNLGDFKEDKITFQGGGAYTLLNPMKGYDVTIKDATVITNNNLLTIDNSLSLNQASSSLDLGTSQAYVKQLSNYGTLNALASSIFITRSATFSGNLTLNSVEVLDGGELSTSNDITITSLTLQPGSQLTIESGTILTTNSFSAVGTPTKPIQIKSTLKGSQGFINQTGGDVTATYVEISDNDILGGFTYTLVNSLNTGNVTGWLDGGATSFLFRWINGSGNWSDLSHWEYSADGGNTYLPATFGPGFYDDVVFEPSSFTAPNQQVVVDQISYCRNMTWTTDPAQTPTLYNTEDLSLYIGGSLILANGVKRSTFDLRFRSFNPGNVIDMADNQTGGFFGGIIFSGTGEWTLQSDLVTTELDCNGGTFNTNNFDVYADSWSFGNNGFPIIINVGSSNIFTSEFTDSSDGNLTFNAGSSTFHIINSTEKTNKIDGPFSFYDVSIEADASIRSANTYNSLTVSSGVKVKLKDNQYQLTQALALNGTSSAPITIASTSPGSQGVFSVPTGGSVTATYVSLTDNKANGGADFTATNSSQISNVTGWNGLKLGQTINFPALNDITLTETLNLQAYASSGLPITYSVSDITGSATISNGVLTPTTSGLVAIDATQTGNSTYATKTATQYVHLNEGIYPNELGWMKQASYAIGVSNGVSTGPYTFTSKSVYKAVRALVTPDGKLIVGGENRLLIWNQIPATYGVPADVVVGQLDFTSQNTVASQTTLAPNTSDFFSGDIALGPNGELIASDGRGVLIWNTIPTTNGVPADVIIGQTDFISTGMGVAQDKFISPFGIAVSKDGQLIVADATANRVLIYTTIPQTNGAMADYVIGQPDFTSSFAGTTAQNLNIPFDVAITPDNKLLIADAFNNRILVYNSIPTANFQAADGVIGQNDFTSTSLSVANNSFTPTSIDVSRTGKLAITDIFNSRVLIYNSTPVDNSSVADIVLGQPNFTTNEVVDLNNISLRSISESFGVSWDLSENLYIVDKRIRRVMVYGIPDVTPPAAFTTGAVVTVGGTSNPTYFIGSNTGVDVTVPIDNDYTLEGGSVQIQLSIDGGAFVDVGAPVTIALAQLGNPVTVSVDAAEILAHPDFVQGGTLTFRAVIADVIANSTIGAASTDTYIVDTQAPPAFNVGLVAPRGGANTGYWNSGSTNLEINFDLPNDPSLENGSIQAMVDVAGNGFTDVGNPVNIALSDLGNPNVVILPLTDLEALTGIAEGAQITTTVKITDVAGNTTTGTASSNIITIDRTVAGINVSQSSIPAVFTSGQNTQAIIKLDADVSGIASFKLFYQLASDGYNSVNSIPITKNTNDEYVFDLSVLETVSEPTGLSFYLEITDNAGNTQSGANNRRLITVNYTDGVTLNMFGTGTKTEDYRIMATPILIDNNAVENIFTTIYGGSFDNTKMRVFSYAGGTTTSYNELEFNSNLELGKGYFTLANTSTSSVSSPSGKTAFSVLQTNDGTEFLGYEVTLVPGWNMIGNPFLHDIVWSDVVTASDIAPNEVDQLQTYENGNWINLLTLKTGQGAFVFNNTGANFTLKIPAIDNTGGRRTSPPALTNPLASENWEVLLTSTDEKGNDILLGGVGMQPDADTSKDAYDLLNPPAFTGSKLIEFEHPEFMVHSFKKDIRPTSDTQVWKFTYKLDTDGSIPQTLRWNNSYFADGPELYLLDKTHFAVVNMKEASSYTFNHGKTTAFEIHYGYDIEESLIPNQNEVQAPFPNPFSEYIQFNVGLANNEAGQIKIDIFNALGERVKTLEQEKALPGYTSLSWNGRGNQGTLPAGVYTYRMFITNKNETIVKTGRIVKK